MTHHILIHFLFQSCTDNAAKAKRLRKGVSKAVMSTGGTAGTAGARAENKTPTSKDRTEDGQINSDNSGSRNGLNEDEQTMTSATVRLPYRNGAEEQAGTGATGSSELMPMTTIDSARAGEEDLEG